MEKALRQTPWEQVTHLLGNRPDGSSWRISYFDAIRLVEDGTAHFHITRANLQVELIVVNNAWGYKCLRPIDDAKSEVLLSLPTPNELDLPSTPTYRSPPEGLREMTIDVAEAMAQMIKSLVETHGFELPIHVAVVSMDGRFVCGTYFFNTDGERCFDIAVGTSKEHWRAPITLVFVESKTGKAWMARAQG